MISDYLGEGAENALSTTALAELTGCSPGDVRQQIKQARRKGWLICSKTGIHGGYYLPGRSTDFFEFCASLERRIYCMIATYTIAMSQASQIEPHTRTAKLCEKYSRKTRLEMHQQIDEAHKARIEGR